MPSTTENFKRIALIAKPDAAELPATLHNLNDFLLSSGLKVVLDDNAAKQMGGLQSIPIQEIGKACDLALVVGGDGTLLNAARCLVADNVPLIGINLGRLGFLVDISPDEMLQSLSSILQGDYLEEHRFLLNASIGDRVQTLAFNDVVLHKWNVARMIEFNTIVDNHLVNAQRSDGIIVATPTGSTAYALSGGGPLLEPGLDAISLVPICPHTLSNRPIVVHGSSQITISVCGRTDHKHVRVTCDGQESMEIQPGEKLVIKKHADPIRLFHPSSHDHFELLRAKLGWGEHPK